jgi:hypothetical protein
MHKEQEHGQLHGFLNAMPPYLQPKNRPAKHACWSSRQGTKVFEKSASSVLVLFGRANSNGPTTGILEIREAWHHNWPQNWDVNQAGTKTSLLGFATGFVCICVIGDLLEETDNVIVPTEQLVSNVIHTIAPHLFCLLRHLIDREIREIREATRDYLHVILQ